MLLNKILNMLLYKVLNMLLYKVLNMLLYKVLNMLLYKVLNMLLYKVLNMLLCNFQLPRRILSGALRLLKRNPPEALLVKTADKQRKPPVGREKDSLRLLHHLRRAHEKLAPKPTSPRSGAVCRRRRVRRRLVRRRLGRKQVGEGVSR